MNFARRVMENPIEFKATRAGKLEDLLSLSGVLGVVECDKAGNVVSAEGDEAEMLGNILVYFQQMADLIGESLGLDPMEEAQMQGNSISAICMPKEDKSYGVLMSSKAKPLEVLPALHSLT